jgi:hypothetical protein
VEMYSSACDHQHGIGISASTNASAICDASSPSRMDNQAPHAKIPTATNQG